jgi:hypothetical protein
MLLTEGAFAASLFFSRTNNKLSAAMIADDENMRLYILDRLGRREATLGWPSLTISLMRPHFRNLEAQRSWDGRTCAPQCVPCSWEITGVRDAKMFVDGARGYGHWFGRKSRIGS